MVTIKINATEAQIKKLLKGQTVQLKHSQLGHGVDLDLHPENIKKIHHSMKHKKGTRIALSEHELSGNGILGKKADKFLKKVGIKKAVYSAASALKPLAHELIDQAGAMADTYVPGLGTMASHAANIYIDNPDKYQQRWKNGDGPSMDQGAIGNQLGTKAAEMLTAKMAERTAKQNGGAIRRARQRGRGNPYMPVSLSGGGYCSPGDIHCNPNRPHPNIRAFTGLPSKKGLNGGSLRPPIQLRDDQSNFIGVNSNAFFPLLPKTVAAFQRGGSFKL